MAVRQPVLTSKTVTILWCREFYLLLFVSVAAVAGPVDSSTEGITRELSTMTSEDEEDMNLSTPETIIPWIQTTEETFADVTESDAWESNEVLPPRCPVSEADSTTETTPAAVASSQASQASRFRLHTRGLRWMEALDSCWREGGRLAVPRAAHEAQLLGRLLAAAAPNITGTDMRDAVFVGVNDIAHEGRWITSDGEPLAATGYAGWLVGGASNGPEHDCGALLVDGRYVQQRCGERLAYACEPVVRSSAAAAATGAGAADYAEVRGLGLYKLHEAPLPWAKARAACAGEGAALVVAASPREAGLLAGVLTVGSTPRVRDGGFFVGLNDLAEEGDWRTLDGKKMSSSAAWVPGEPSGGREENCGTLQADGRFAAAQCSEPRAYCCKKTAPWSGEGDGYVAWEGLGLYRLHAEGQDWMQALLQCRRENASLAVPNSPDEARALVRMLSDAAGSLKAVAHRHYQHVGIHDIDGDGQWLTISGKTLSEAGYENWWRGWSYYPKNNGDKCVVLDVSVTHFNNPCKEKYAFVCERPL